MALHLCKIGVLIMNIPYRTRYALKRGFVIGLIVLLAAAVALFLRQMKKQ